MSVVTVAVDGRDPIRLRAVSALLADHRIDRLGILGASPPKSWGERVERLAVAGGWDIVVGLDPVGDQLSVTPAAGGDVSWAGPTGLTRTLGRQVGDCQLAATVPGDPLKDGPRFGFPSPIGWLRGASSNGIHHCPHASTVAGVMAVTADGHSLAIVDEQEFLDACALAAGIILASQGRSGPVWENPDAYLDAVTSMGLVVADRPSVG